MTNEQILNAIFNKYLEWGYSEKYANTQIRCMSTEDIGCFYAENCQLTTTETT